MSENLTITDIINIQNELNEKYINTLIKFNTDLYNLQKAIEGTEATHKKEIESTINVIREEFENTRFFVDEHLKIFNMAIEKYSKETDTQHVELKAHNKELKDLMQVISLKLEQTSSDMKPLTETDKQLKTNWNKVKNLLWAGLVIYGLVQTLISLNFLHLTWGK